MQGEDAWKLESALNVTPLIDIVLVLLITFMVSSNGLKTAAEQALPLQLPRDGSGASVPVEGAVHIRLLPNGKLSIEDEEIEHTQALSNKLHLVLKTTGKKRVVLEGDEASLLGKTIEVLSAAESAGAEEFSIRTEKGTSR
jgi:biopolymer transport protein ExbD